LGPRLRGDDIFAVMTLRGDDAIARMAGSGTRLRS
jgi:hypothetical protein